MAIANAGSATNYTPNRLDDPTYTSIDFTTGVMTGGPGNGTISLRSALIAADNNGVGPHTVTLSAGTYDLSEGEIFFGSNPQRIT